MYVCIKVASRSVPNSLPHLFVAVVSDRVRGSPQPKTSDEVGTPRAGYRVREEDTQGDLIFECLIKTEPLTYLHPFLLLPSPVVWSI